MRCCCSAGVSPSHQALTWAGVALASGGVSRVAGARLVGQGGRGVQAGAGGGVLGEVPQPAGDRLVGVPGVAQGVLDPKAERLGLDLEGVVLVLPGHRAVRPHRDAGGLGVAEGLDQFGLDECDRLLGVGQHTADELQLVVGGQQFAGEQVEVGEGPGGCAAGPSGVVQSVHDRPLPGLDMCVERRHQGVVAGPGGGEAGEVGLQDGVDLHGQLLPGAA